MAEVKEQLGQEISSLIEAMGDLDSSSPEYAKSANMLGLLLDKYNAMTHEDHEYWSKHEDRDKDYNLREKQLEEDRRDHIIKNVLTAISVLGGFGVTIWGTNKSLKFEETGVVGSNAGREFIKRLFHMK